MTSDEYATLMDFLATRFARMDARFEAIEDRLTRAEVLQESMRDDIRRVAEGVVAVNERLDRFQVEVRERFDGCDRRFDRIDARFAEIDVRFDRIDARFAEIDVRFDRFTVDFGTVQLDHGARFEALERHRRRLDPGG